MIDPATWVIAAIVLGVAWGELQWRRGRDAERRRAPAEIARLRAQVSGLADDAQRLGRERALRVSELEAQAETWGQRASAAIRAASVAIRDNGGQS